MTTSAMMTNGENVMLLLHRLKLVPLAIACVTVSVPTLLRSQVCVDSSMAIESTDGNPGEEVQVAMRGHSVCPVEAFSFALGYDPVRVRLLEVRPGSFFVDIFGVDFTFVPNDNPEGGYVSVAAFLLDPRNPGETLPTVIPSNTVLATFRFLIFPAASPGTMPLGNQNRAFGVPPIDHIYAGLGGTVISPALGAGTILVRGTCGARLDVTEAAGRPGQRVQVTLRGESTCAVEGFSLAIGHDPERVTLVGVAPGPLLVNRLGAGLLFNFVAVEAAGYTSVVAVFLDAKNLGNTAPTAIPPRTALATLTYEINANARPGVMVLLNEDRAFGEPFPIDHVFVTKSRTIAPVLTSGAVTIEGGPQRFALAVDAPETVGRGETFTVDLRGTSTSNLAGFATLVTYDPQRLRFVGEDFAGSVWDNSDLRQVNDDGQGSIRIGVVRNVDNTAPPNTEFVSAGDDLLFLRLSFAAGVCPGSTTIGLSSGVNDTLFVDSQFVGRNSTQGLMLSADVVTALETGFIRGNVDGGPMHPDNPRMSVNILDGLSLLRFLYAGGEAPPCADAADANDDGRLNLFDSIWIFQWILGNPAVETLPEPFLVVGQDVTPDALECGIVPRSEPCE